MGRGVESVRQSLACGEVSRRAAPGRRRAGPRRVLAVAALVAVSACTSLEGPGYLWQSIGGHLDLMRRARPITDLLAAPDTSPRLRAKLEVALRARAFAVRELALPDNGSYTRYSALERDFVLWNVFAAPELSLELRSSCFPVAGCVAYRGYYSREDAERYAQQLRADGLDVNLAGVPAYSTLGWFDDPLPSPVARYPDAELARLVFHELAHQVVYVKGDSTFNESYATAVEEAGVARWLAASGTPAQQQEYARFSGRRREFRELLGRHRAALSAAYAAGSTDDAKRDAKRRQFDALRADFAELRAAWGGYAGFDRWFDQPLGNAHLAAIGTYTDLVPAFTSLLARCGEDFTRFHAEVRRIAALAKAQRDDTLRVLARHDGSDPRRCPPR